MKMMKESPKFRSKKLFLLLPTLCALLVTVGRSIYHSSFGGGSSSESHVHRLAAAGKTSSSFKKNLSPRKLRPSNHIHFKPTKRDLHVDILSSNDRHHVQLSKGLPGDRRRLVNPVLGDEGCKTPTLSCDIAYAATYSGDSKSIPEAPADLYKINVVTGDEERIGPIGYGINGLAYDGKTNTLFGNGNHRPDGRFPESAFVTIDPCTGNATLQGSEARNRTSNLAVDSRGNIYAWMYYYNALASIDKTNGHPTQVGDHGLKGIDGVVSSMAFDDTDALHVKLIDDDQQYVIDVPKREGLLKGDIDTDIDFMEGDIQPGTSLLYSPSMDGTGIQVIDLATNSKSRSIATTNNYSAFTFVCDKPSYLEYGFALEVNRTHTTDNTTYPMMFKVTGPGVPIEKFPPPPGHVAKPPPGGENVASELQNAVNAIQPPIDTGDATVRYEVPINTDYSIPFAFFMQVDIDLIGAGPEARVSLQIYRVESDDSKVRITNSSPLLRSNGLVFFVPLQVGNHTVQLTDGSGVPIEESDEFQISWLGIKTYPYETTA